MTPAGPSGVWGLLSQGVIAYRTTNPLGALGEVGAAYAAGLDKATTKGGVLYVFSLD